MAQLTGQIADPNISGIAPRLQDPVDTTAASAIELAGNVMLDVDKAKRTQGLREELEPLNEKFVADPQLLKEADNLQGGAEKELNSAKTALKQGLMSESMYAAKANNILKKYIMAAPGLTPEFTQIAQGIVGFDPASRLVQLAIKGRADLEASSGAQDKLFKEQYNDTRNSANKYGINIDPIHQYDWDTLQELRTKINVEVAEDSRIQREKAKMEHSAKAQSALLAQEMSMEGKKLTGRFAEIFNSVTDPTNTEQRGLAVKELEAMKLELQNKASDYHYAPNKDAEVNRLISRIDDAIKDVDNSNNQTLWSNTVKMNTDKYTHELLSRNNNAGWKLLAGKPISEISDTQAFKRLVYKFGVENFGGENSLNFGGNNKQAANNSTKLQDTATALINSGATKDEKTTIMSIIRDDYLGPKIDQFQQLISRMQRNPDAVDDGISTTALEVMALASTVDKDTLTTSDKNAISIAGQQMITGARDLLATGNYSISINDDGKVMIDATKNGLDVNVIEKFALQKQLNNTKDFLGLDDEAFMSQLQQSVSRPVETTEREPTTSPLEDMATGIVNFFQEHAEAVRNDPTTVDDFIAQWEKESIEAREKNATNKKNTNEAMEKRFNAVVETGKKNLKALFDALENAGQNYINPQREEPVSKYTPEAQELLSSGYALSDIKEFLGDKVFA